jgi:cyclophilin family peptidyl-prolyl cis-trans isomerase
LQNLEGFVIRRVSIGASLFVVVSLCAAADAAAQSGSSSSKPAASQTSKPAAQTAKPAPSTAKPAAATAATASDAAPIIVVETERGTFEFETYPKEAPKTVAHIVALVKRNFYNGQRIHRVAPNFVIQFGDPNTRDFRLKDQWGSGSSGKPIGVLETSPSRPHKVGSVAMARGPDPGSSDSQMYVVLATERTGQLDGAYTVFGQVISGMNVVQQTKKDDLIKRVTIKAGTPPTK